MPQNPIFAVCCGSARSFFPDRHSVPPVFFALIEWINATPTQQPYDPQSPVSSHLINPAWFPAALPFLAGCLLPPPDLMTLCPVPLPLQLSAALIRHSSVLLCECLLEHLGSRIA